MTDPRHIRDLPAKDRPLSRRVRLWHIRTITRRGGAFLTGRNPNPGHPRDIFDDAVRVGRQTGSNIVPRVNRATWREHRRRCAALGVDLPKSVRRAEIVANMLRKGVAS
jgi:hypothetical protein